LASTLGKLNHVVRLGLMRQLGNDRAECADPLGQGGVIRLELPVVLDDGGKAVFEGGDVGGVGPPRARVWKSATGV
jgi:hypothetical protein